MAERYRTAAGNWSNAAQWDGGVSLPGVGDDCYSNNFAITIDTSITVLSLRNTAGATAVAGGSFVAADGVTVNADDVYAGTVTCYTAASTAILNGDTHGGTAANARGASLTGSAVQNGDSYGGSSASAAGTNLQNMTIQRGNSHAGSAGPGTSNGGTQIGDAIAGATSVAASQVGGGGFHIGDSYGGSVANAVGVAVTTGGIHYGRCFGGTHATAYGSTVASGGTVIVTQITDSTAPALRMTNEGSVILHGGTTAAQVSNGASAGRFSITRGTSETRSFVRPPTHSASIG